MDGPEAALLVTAGSHVVGAIFLVWYLLRQGGDPQELRRWWHGEEGDGDDPAPVAPAPRPSGDGIPLPDAAPAPVRLRGRDRLRDAYPRPARRPEHPPAPVPVHERDHR